MRRNHGRHRRTPEKPPIVPSELKCYLRLKAKGYHVSKRGWPDLFVEKPDGTIACVEVKPSKNCRLEYEQIRILRALARHGIQCYRWSPDIGYRRIFAGGGVDAVSGDAVRSGPES